MNTNASVMVPVEPTEAMCLAGYMKITRDIEDGPSDMPNVWRAMLAAAPAQAAPLSMLALLHGDGEVTPEMIAAVKAKDCDGMPLSYREIYMVMHKARPASAPAQAAPELPEPVYRTNDSETPCDLFSAAQMHAYRIAEPCYCRRCHPTLGEPAATPPATAHCVSDGGLTAAEREALEKVEANRGYHATRIYTSDLDTLCAALRRLQAQNHG